MWILDKRSYYLYDDDGELQGCLIRLPSDDAFYPDGWSIQFYSSDGGIVLGEHIANKDFNLDIAKEIVEACVAENKPFNWWMDH